MGGGPEIHETNLDEAKLFSLIVRTPVERNYLAFVSIVFRTEGARYG